MHKLALSYSMTALSMWYLPHLTIWQHGRNEPRYDPCLLRSVYMVATIEAIAWSRGITVQ